MKKFIIVLFAIVIAVTVAYFAGFNSIFSTPGSKSGVDAIERFKGDVDEAKERYKDHIQSAEQVGTAYEKLANQYLFRKNWTPAIESYTKAIEYGRTGARVHYSIAVAYGNRGKELGNKGDIALAESHYKLSLEKNPNITDSKYGYAILKFYIKNDKKDALRMMKSIANNKPGYLKGRFALARFYYEMGNPAKSLSVYEDLYSDLEGKYNSKKVKEYKKYCKANITRLMAELSKQK